MRNRCEMKRCISSRKDRHLIAVIENIGDGAYRVSICRTCAKLLGVKPEQDLPEAYIVDQKIDDFYKGELIKKIPNREIKIKILKGTFTTNDIGAVISDQTRQVRWLYKNGFKCTKVIEEKMVRLIVSKLQKQYPEIMKIMEVTRNINYIIQGLSLLKAEMKKVGKHPQEFINETREKEIAIINDIQKSFEILRGK